MSKKELKDIKVGDFVICDNTPDHDYETYILLIESVEEDEEFITETNPRGVVAFGRGYTKEENEFIDEIGYAFRCSEENFVDFYTNIDTAVKIFIELNNDMTLVVAHTDNGKIFSYTVMGVGENRTNEIVGFVNEKEEQDLFEWVLSVSEADMNKVEKRKQGIIIPCGNSEDVCNKIEDLIATYLSIMDYTIVKYDVRSFWRTLCAFMVRHDDSAVLSRFYDTNMSDENKNRVTRGDFIDFMLVR